MKTVKLKQMAIAYKLAAEWDYCPDTSGDMAEMAEYLGLDNMELLEGILDKYCGLSPGEIVSRIIEEIEEIKE